MKTQMRYLSLMLLLAFVGVAKAQEVNDMTTPLHLLKPDYKIPYGETTKQEVSDALERIFRYVDSETPYALKADGTLERGAFRIGSYEWGIT